MKPSIAARFLMLSFGLLCVMLSASSSAQTSVSNPPIASFTQSGNQFSSKEGRFTITLPSDFPALQHSQSTTTTAVGAIELHLFTSETARGACLIGYADYPAGTFAGRTSEKILEDGRDGSFTSANATLEKQEHTTIQGYPALIVYSTASLAGKPIYVRFDYVLAQPRSYQVGFLAFDRAVLDQPVVQEYFKSFRLEKGQ